MKRNQKFVALSVSAIFLVAFLVSFSSVSAKQNGGNGGSKKEKSEKTKEIKNYEKPTKEKTNAKIHDEKTNVVGEELKGAAKKEDENAKALKEEKTKDAKTVEEENKAEEISETLGEVAQEVQETGDTTAEAIEEVEKRNKFKTLLIGTDYKNLGQLRSSLVHNRNQIRRLTNVIGSITDPAVLATAQEQLTLLNQEGERIKTVIQENEGGFSILGWASKLLSGYTEEPINEEEEQLIENEVVEALSKEVTSETTESEGTETTQTTQETTQEGAEAGAVEETVAQ